MIDVAGQTAVVLGLGQSGLAMARALSECGAVVRVADTRDDPPMRAALDAELPQVRLIRGPFERGLLDGATLLALSPGLSPTHSAAAPIVTAARKAGIDVVGEVELFARALAGLKASRDYAPRVVGVTGTNGKTTTARLTALLIERSARTVALAGNISPTALDALRECLRTGRLPTTWVLELSSFQLATTRSLACDAATVLNISEDHLDWHGSFEAYVKAKARIFSPGTVQVLNRDDPVVAAMARKTAPVKTFRLQPPTQADEYGLVSEGGITWLAYAENLTRGHRRRRVEGELEAAADELFVHRLMPADALAIRGRHNAGNALAALALARAIGCPLAPMLHALRSYRGEPHRVQRIATVGGVHYYDDSKGTNVGATVAALDGLAAEGLRLVVILGGDGKGQNFVPLAAPLARAARAVVLIGRDAALIEQAIGAAGAPFPIVRAASLEQAVDSAAGSAREGDAVLLSPACASLDMFRDYVHRAEVFAVAVQARALREGQPCSGG
jgi:UDP-N-acetylmuramoylalanine--D-glutamate ligase